MPDGTLTKLSGKIPSDPKEIERLMAGAKSRNH
jgi:hypothetical protein